MLKMNQYFLIRFQILFVLWIFVLPLSAAEPVVITANDDWKAIDTEDLVAKPGTALDFSARLGTEPAGSKGRVIAMPDGRLAFQSAPDQPVRFFGCTLEVGKNVPSDPDGIEAFAEAIRLQGYNIVRINFLDCSLGNGWEKWGVLTTPEELAEFDRQAAAGKPPFNAAILDRFDRFVAALKKRGIYLYMDAMTSWVGYYPVNPWHPNSAIVTNMGAGLYDSNGTGRTHWHDCVKALFTHINPYTQTSLVSDPQVVTILGHNEVNFNFYFPDWRKKYEGPLLPLWRKFLAKRYKDVNEWELDWGGITPTTPVTSFSDVPLFKRDDLKVEGHRSRIVADFLAPLEDNLSSWFQSELRSFGYQGLYSVYDMLCNLRLYMPRAKMSLVSMHNYYDHPNFGEGEAATIHNTSAIGESLNWWRSTLGCRIAGKPFAVTEYGQVYWNQYRYEEGLSVGAYGAFQDVSMLFVHADPVVMKSSFLDAFRPGSDPVARASQVVTGILFMGSAITPAAHRVDVSIFREQSLNFSESSLSGDLTRVALVTGFAAAPEDARFRIPADDTLLFRDGAQSLADSIYSASVVDTGNGRFNKYVELLKKKKILPMDNLTSGDIYENESGQITLNADKKTLQVATPTVAGICAEQVDKQIVAGSLYLDSASVPVSVTVAALDKKDISLSQHLLLVLATNAHNTNETFADSTEKVRIKRGTLPVLVRTGQFNLTIGRIKGAPVLKAWTLALNGTRQSPLEVESIEKGIRLKLNTAEWPGGPTPFVELEEN